MQKYRSGYRQKRWIRTVLRIFIGAYLHIRYNLRVARHSIAYATPNPCIILGNHSANWDPFFVNIYTDKSISFITSDAHYRNPLLRWALGLVNSIPKTKAISDARTIRKIIQVCKHRGAIGIFPEGQSCWDGRSTAPLYATAKLIRALKLPVLYAQIQGAFLSCGRWCRSSRKGRVQVTFHRLLLPKEIKTLSTDDIYQKLHECTKVDQLAAQRTLRIAYRGRAPAQYLERSLFICPSCYKIGTMRSGHSIFSCTACAYAVRFNVYGLFESCGEKAAPQFETIGEWNEWQQRFLSIYIDKSTDETVLFSDTNCKLTALTQGKRILRKTAAFSMYKDHFFFLTKKNISYRFPLTELSGINIQKNEKMEFSYRHALYSVKATSARGCMYKYLLAAQLLHTQSLQSSS